MSNKEKLVLPYDGDAQSANTLFHFMNKSEYLNSFLLSKALVPRYYMGNIKYLGLSVGDIQFNEVAVLQKCCFSN